MTRAPKVIIVGGGIIGSLTAWFLRKVGFGGVITVVERDPTYRFSSTALSAASIRTQFGCPVNVELSLFGGRFLSGIRQRLAADVEIGFVEDGYLILCDSAHLDVRLQQVAMQRSLGAQVETLSKTALDSRFPWMSSNGLALGTLGSTGEGWFDAWSLLQATRSAAVALGATYRHSEVTGFETRGDRVTAVRLSEGEALPCDWCVNAAGALSGRVAALLGIEIPVVPRKRTVFNFRAPLDVWKMPMLFDVSGAWIRPEGDGFIAGIQPDLDSDLDAYGDFEPDHQLFEDRLWPILASRVPKLEQVRLSRSWAGHYEMNLFDQNGIVGPHSRIQNLLFATGFSGHGVMHAPGVARALTELIHTGRYQTIDVTPLGYERIEARAPLLESAIY